MPNQTPQGALYCKVNLYNNTKKPPFEQALGNSGKEQSRPRRSIYYDWLGPMMLETASDTLIYIDISVFTHQVVE